MFTQQVDNVPEIFISNSCSFAATQILNCNHHWDKEGNRTTNLVRRSIRLISLRRSEISPITPFMMLTNSSGPSQSGVIREYQRLVTHSDTMCLVNWSIAVSTTGEFTLIFQHEASQAEVWLLSSTAFLWEALIVEGTNLATPPLSLLRFSRS